MLASSSTARASGGGLGERQKGLEPRDPRSHGPHRALAWPWWGPGPEALPGLSSGSGRLALTRACALGLARVGVWDIPPPVQSSCFYSP